jgi:hypothetical protein
MDTKKTETTVKNRRHLLCNHPSLAKEFVFGLPTGDYICAQCGLPLSYILRATQR